MPVDDLTPPGSRAATFDGCLVPKTTILPPQGFRVRDNNDAARGPSGAQLLWASRGIDTSQRHSNSTNRIDLWRAGSTKSLIHTSQTQCFVVFGD